MDRHDERKPVPSSDEARDAEVRQQDDRKERQGDVLGLTGTDVPKSPDDPSTEYDPKSVAKRRQRVADPAQPGVSERDDAEPRKGATGIDMGAGGSGTGIKRD